MKDGDYFVLFGLDLRKPLVILFFMSTSVMAILLNKALFSSYRFPCPLLATSFQFFVAVIILLLLFLVGQVYPRVQLLKSISLDRRVAFSVLPVSLTFLFMVCLNNYFLMAVGVGFYAIGKSLAIPFSVGLSYFLLAQPSSRATVAACLLISGGVFVSSFFEIDVNLSGLFLGVLSSIFTAGYQIAVKRGLIVLEGDQWKLSYYNSLWVVVLLPPLAMLSGETDAAWKALLLVGEAGDGGDVSGGAEFNWPLLGVLVLSGVMGFLIGQATYMSIHYTSALAHHVTGAVKSCVQTALGILIWHEPATLTNLSGLALTLGGSYLFMQSRMEPPKRPSSREATV